MPPRSPKPSPDASLRPSSASQHPRSLTAPTGQATLTHFSTRRSPPDRPALLHGLLTPLSPPRDSCSSALPRCQPRTAPAGRSGLPASTASSSGSHQRPARRLAGLSPSSGRGAAAPPAPASPLQRAATCGLSCKASSRRSLSTAGMLALRRGWAQGARCAAEGCWHAPAAGLGGVPPRGGGRSSPQAAAHGGEVAWLRWWGGGGSSGPLTPPSSRPPEEASHGEGWRLEGRGRRAVASCRH